ncbi:MAG: hypothetical protein M1379_12840 [Firmicutes bacterium]|nr:hypothetical protein [Bacillota bacterium]
MAEKGVYIFTGGYGSGKTEVAINYAAHVAEGESSPPAPTSLIDLDIVNLYFRSREVRGSFAQRGIKVISSVEKFEMADVPSLSPAISATLQDRGQAVVVDVGGDPVGATVLGRYNPYLKQRGYEFFMVVNPYRPFTARPDDVAVLAAEIEQASRLKITRLVSNPNLSGETTLEDVKSGHKAVRACAERMGIPMAFLVVMERLAGEMTGSHAGSDGAWLNGLPVFPLKLYMQMPWA